MDRFILEVKAKEDFVTLSKSPLDLLIRARDLLKDSWCQMECASKHMPNGQIFMSTDSALCYASHGNVAWAGDHIEDACQYLAEAIGGADIFDIIRWDQVEGRSKEDVLAAYDKAIKLASSVH